MTAISNMGLSPVPEIAKKVRPHGRVFPIGPPRGFSDDAVGTVEAMFTVELIDGRHVPCYRDYWRPTKEQLEILNKGGFIELAQYSPEMIMHGLQVWGDPDNADR